MNTITVHGKQFAPFLSEEQIASACDNIAASISDDYKGKNPLFLAILNGSFIFASDVFRRLSIEAEISFIKLASYKGTTSTGKIITAIGLEETIHERHIIILEDIIDTGTTLFHFLPELQNQAPLSLKIAALLNKQQARTCNIQPDYCGFDIPDKFVVGYGLDYDGLGRNIPCIYALKE